MKTDYISRHHMAVPNRSREQLPPDISTELSHGAHKGATNSGAFHVSVTVAKLQHGQHQAHLAFALAANGTVIVAGTRFSAEARGKDAEIFAAVAVEKARSP